jgi:hypothetical protein
MIATSVPPVSLPGGAPLSLNVGGDPVPAPGHDSLCERGRGTIPEECHCPARAFTNDPGSFVAADPPWGLFAFERGHPDTRGHKAQGPSRAVVPIREA